MKTLKNKKTYLVLAFLLLVGYFAYGKYFKKPAIQYNTAKVEQGTLRQTVTETGVIKHANEVSLNFLSQGRLATSSAKVGSFVKKGQVLAELDYTSLKIQARQAQANLDIAIANEQKILRGATYQDINIGQTAVNQAQVSLENARKDLLKTAEADMQAEAQAKKALADLEDKSINTPAEASVNSAQVSLNKNTATYQKMIDNRIETLLVAVHDKISVAKNALDNANRVLTDENAKDTLSVRAPGKLTDARNDYDIALALDQGCGDAYALALKTKNILDVKSASDYASDYLSKAIVALNATFSVLENSVVSSKFTQAQLDAFKSNIANQISLANAGLSSLEQSRQALDDAANNYDSVVANSKESLNIAQANLENARLQASNSLSNVRLAKARNFQAAQARVDASQEALKLAQAQLNKTSANSRPEDINLAKAQVRQAQANLDGIMNLINNDIIIAPFDGQITQANYEVGEEPAATRPVFVLMGENQFEIEVDIAESDIAKIGIGNPVDIDFDAFGQGIKFFGKVDAIDPAQTVIQEVVYYRGTIRKISTATSSAEYLKQIKPGMTANVTIMANKKDNALIIPFRAVTDNNGRRTVRVLKNGQPVETAVDIGLRGDDGLVEVLSGISAGDEIILSTKTN
jgi:RND family efflux transporter MFP subunit